MRFRMPLFRLDPDGSGFWQLKQGHLGLKWSNAAGAGHDYDPRSLEGTRLLVCSSRDDFKTEADARWLFSEESGKPDASQALLQRWQSMIDTEVARMPSVTINPNNIFQYL